MKLERRVWPIALVLVRCTQNTFHPFMGDRNGLSLHLLTLHSIPPPNAQLYFAGSWALQVPFPQNPAIFQLAPSCGTHWQVFGRGRPLFSLFPAAHGSGSGRQFGAPGCWLWQFQSPPWPAVVSCSLHGHNKNWEIQKHADSNSSWSSHLGTGHLFCHPASCNFMLCIIYTSFCSFSSCFSWLELYWCN
jgi:hypothetical protein